MYLKKKFIFDHYSVLYALRLVNYIMYGNIHVERSLFNLIKNELFHARVKSFFLTLPICKQHYIIHAANIFGLFGKVLVI